MPAATFVFQTASERNPNPAQSVASMRLKIYSPYPPDYGDHVLYGKIANYVKRPAAYAALLASLFTQPGCGPAGQPGPKAQTGTEAASSPPVNPPLPPSLRLPWPKRLNAALGHLDADPDAQPGGYGDSRERTLTRNRDTYTLQLRRGPAPGRDGLRAFKYRLPGGEWRTVIDGGDIDEPHLNGAFPLDGVPDWGEIFTLKNGKFTRLTLARSRGYMETGSMGANGTRKSRLSRKETKRLADEIGVTYIDIIDVFINSYETP